MYSVVILMALTANADAPEFCHKSCCGCCCYSSCCGYSYCHGCCGCYSYGCCGCYSGYSGCCGCYSGCSGCYSSCYSCYSSCYSCGGCCSCYSGCYGCGYVSSGSYGYAGAVAYSAPVTYGYSGVVAYSSPVIATPAASVVPENTATLVVNLPAAATLTIDGYTTKSTSATRTFVTPPLEPGKAYNYTLKATVKVGDKTEEITKVVNVMSGQETKETLTLPVRARCLRGNRMSSRIDPKTAPPSGASSRLPKAVLFC